MTGMDAGLDNSEIANNAFTPDLKPGEMAGQASLRVSAWTVTDVSKWLQSISLGQYRTCFMDAAVDGAFLFDIDDDDLKNTLGVEHRLHRKKILNTIIRLKETQDTRDREASLSAYQDKHPPAGFNAAAMGYNPASGVMGFAGVPPGFAPPGGGMAGAMVPAGMPMGSVEGDDSIFEGAIDLNIQDMASWVRHNKYKKLSKALEQMAPRKFDRTYIKVQYVEEFGTQYIDSYEREFHLNQPVDHGNTLMHIASQNGNLKLAKLLQRYGANVDHQNFQGQTPGHFALAYTFYDFSSWLFDPGFGGADDTLVNIFHLGPYDGLTGEDQDNKAVVQAIEN